MPNNKYLRYVTAVKWARQTQQYVKNAVIGGGYTTPWDVTYRRYHTERHLIENWFGGRNITYTGGLFYNCNIDAQFSTRNLENTIFVGCVFTGSFALDYGVFENCVFDGCVFTHQAYFNNSLFHRCSFHGSTVMRGMYAPVRMMNCDVSGLYGYYHDGNRLNVFPYEGGVAIRLASPRLVDSGTNHPEMRFSGGLYDRRYRGEFTLSHIPDTGASETVILSEIFAIGLITRYQQSMPSYSIGVDKARKGTTLPITVEDYRNWVIRN